MARTIESYGIRDRRILAAMRAVPRHRFVPELYRRAADVYGDFPVAIGYGQTISQPYIVALSIEMASIPDNARVLEIGCGCGYVAAVLAQMGCSVWALERIGPLARFARETLEQQGYGDRVHVRIADGFGGWPEAAPFDAILVSCAPEERPNALSVQLVDGGRMVVPVGRAGGQRLECCRREGEGFVWMPGIGVRFVPMRHGVEEDDV